MAHERMAGTHANVQAVAPHLKWPEDPRVLALLYQLFGVSLTKLETVKMSIPAYMLIHDI